VSESKRRVQELVDIGFDAKNLMFSRTSNLDVRGSKTDLATLYLFFFNKTQKSFQALSVLWAFGFSEDAYIVLRSIFECYLQCRYTTRAPRKAVRYFRDYFDYSFYDHYLEIPASHKRIKQRFITHHQKDEKTLSQIHARLKKRYEPRQGRKFDWYATSIWSLAKRVGRRTYYRSMYKYLSGYTHASHRTVVRYIERTPARITVINSEPKFEENYLAILDGVRMLLHICEIMDRDLHLQLKDELDILISRWRNAQQKYKLLTFEM
jgi:hypothetical protein